MTVTREALRAYLMESDERVVKSAYPRQMAEALKTDHHQMLTVLAEGLIAGDVILHWGVECPLCHAGGPIDELAEAVGALTCRACGGEFRAHVDDDILVTFSVHPSVRELSDKADDESYRVNIAKRYKPTTGHELLTVQTFRDWAQSETLPPGESLEVSRVAIWFSDLSGSTAMYARRGDPQAFQIVREHFTVLFDVVGQHNGVVVKTIGDSVMAAFVSPADALKAAIASHAAMETFNTVKKLSGADQLLLKVGMHIGPSILVTLNERLDYFGQTINLASRISNLPAGRQIAISDVTYEENGIKDLLKTYAVERREAKVKGVNEAISVHQFTV